MGSPRARRWLWISAEVDDQLSTGLLVYSHGFSSAVAEAGAEVTIIGVGEPKVQRQGIEVIGVPGALRGGVRSVLSPLPNLCFACALPEFRQRLRSLIAAEAFDVIVLDHLQVAWAAEEIPADFMGTIVVVTHNHEGSMRRAAAAELSPLSPRRLVLHLDALKADRLERKTANRADVITSISEHDQQLFRRDAPGAEHVLVPPGWAEPASAPRPPMVERPRRVGIVGSFDWHVKQENLLRFARAAAPVFNRSGVELAIAGSVPDATAAEVQELMPSASIFGWVDSVPEFLATCRIGLVAEPLGGGFKLKSLDYVGLGVPIASLPGTVAGLPLVAPGSMIEADNELLLAEAIERAIDDPSDLELRAAAAQKKCMTHFSWREQVASLFGAIESSR